MNGYSRQLCIKFLLILISEAVAAFMVNMISEYVVLLHYTLMTHVIAGSLLALAVVSLYDLWLVKRRFRVEEELKELTNAALRRYTVKPRKK